MPKISIILDNNAFFLVIIFVISRVFNRKQREYLKICHLAIFLIVIYTLKFQIEDGFPLNFTSLQKCSPNEFFNLETMTSCHYIQHMTLHKNLVCLAIANLKYKDHNNFCQFLLLLSRDASPNPGPVQISLAVSINIWKLLN